MVSTNVFKLNNLNCSIKTLEISDASVLQELYEKCADYNYLMEGKPPSPTAALDEFTTIPEGKSLDDKYMFGIFDCQDKLVGLIEGMQNYPKEKCWWIGLIMISPAYRRQGILSSLIKEFEQWIAIQGVESIMGSVAETNSKVMRLWKQIGFKVVRHTKCEDSNMLSNSFSVIERKICYPYN